MKSKRLLFLIAGVLTIANLYAQKPVSPQWTGELRKSNPVKMDCNDAGRVGFGNFTGISNDRDTPTIYLCFNDSRRILSIDSTVDLSGDPNTTTRGGIGYAFYKCPPTITGPDLASILQDTCLITDPTPTNGLWVAVAPDNSGDITFLNNGAIQDFFSAGGPIQIWFAPITYDKLDTVALPGGTLSFRPTFEGTPVGSCVDVSVDQAFSVVYLNQIIATDRNENAGGNGCRGSFTALGGLPEFAPTTDYRITITKRGATAVRGTLLNNGPIRHDTEVLFSVPEPGVYDIMISDGKSCDGTFSMNMNGCMPVEFIADRLNALPGQRICVDVQVKNFIDVGSAQFTISFDPTVLRFDTVENLNLRDLTPDAFNSSQNGGIAMSWFTPLSGVTLADSTRIFSLCFDVIGTIGESSPINFTGDIIRIEIGDGNQLQLGFRGTNGQVDITDNTIFAGFTVDSVSCPGAADGAINLDISGGTPGYQITWRTLGSTAPANGPFNLATAGAFTIPDLPTGSYSVTISDGANPVASRTDTVMIVTRGPVLEVNYDFTRPVCFGDSTGSINAIVIVDSMEVFNPEGIYSFQWSNGSTARGISNLPSRSYSVTVTDPFGCRDSTQLFLPQPAPLGFSRPQIDTAYCTGSTDGVIRTSATGGTAPFTFEWFNPGDTLPFLTGPGSNLNGLATGMYRFNLTDANNCTFNDSIFLPARKYIIVTVDEAIDPTCFGGDNGRVSISASTQGLPPNTPWQFTWTATPALNNPPTNAGNRSTINGLPAGRYTIVAQDSDPRARCYNQGTIVLSQPDSLSAELVSITDEDCNQPNTGAATVAATGGTPDYTYVWSTTPVTNGPTASGLAAGQYIITITDANNCRDSVALTITRPTPPQVVRLENDTVNCINSQDGQLTVEAIAGNAAIATYSWSSGDTGPTTQARLFPNIYTVTITDAAGCFTVDTAAVLPVTPVSIDSFNTRRPTCPNSLVPDGQIAVFTSGGTMPYSFTWSTGETTNNALLPALRAGDYGVTVTDANNCPGAVLNIVLEDNPAIVVSFDTLFRRGVSCANQQPCNGAAAVTAIYSDGMTAGFSFEWSSGETASGVPSNFASQLCQGFQSVTVTDGICAVVDSIFIPFPPELTVNDTVTGSTPVSCAGSTDGTATIGGAGGTGPYTYSWDNGGFGPMIGNLALGTYIVTITDFLGCTFEQSIAVSGPDTLRADIDPTTTFDISCFDANDGQVGVIVTGGNNEGPNPFTYNWSNGITTVDSNFISNLGPGTYDVTVTDAKGCQDLATWTLTEPEAIMAIIPPVDLPRCFGETTPVTALVLSGNRGPYRFSVDNGRTAFVSDSLFIFGGEEHLISVFDGAGCRWDTTIFVDQPPPIEVRFRDGLQFITAKEIQLGDTSYQIISDISSVVPVDSFYWSPLDSLRPANSLRPFVGQLLRPTTYTLTVIDENGCTGAGSILIDVDRNRNVFIPNIFSPNGDGVNDELRIFTGVGVGTIKSIQLFDRWGEVLVSQTNVSPVGGENGLVVWDGMHNGKKMNPAVFVYLVEVEFIDNITLLYRGDVTLVR